ncbi:MAG TPA: antitoxin family protein [Thermoanaerobaculia bacterium]|nr:antitoxin family protein [Thermoanaerobaculia bacterium]
MTIDVDAVYEKGVLRLKQPVDLPQEAEVHVTIQTDTEAKTPMVRRLRELPLRDPEAGDHAARLGRDRRGSLPAPRRVARGLVKRTFVDAGVLIAAARGGNVQAARAMEVLDDPDREFAASPFLRLEVLPQSIFNKREAERECYEARRNVPVDPSRTRSARAHHSYRYLTRAATLP